MSRIKMILNNIADDAVLVSDPAAVPTLPVAMLQDDRRGRAMRVQATSVTISGSHTEMQVADGVALVRHNLSDLATIRIRLYDGQGPVDGLVYDSGDLLYGDLIPAGEFEAGIDPFGGSYYTPPIAMTWFDATAYSSFRIDIADPMSEDGYLQAGRLIMGLSWSPVSNMSWGSNLEFVDRSVRKRTAAGGLRTRRQERYRRLSVPLDWLTDDDRDRLSSELRAADGRDALVSAYPDNVGIRLSDYTMVAQIVNGASFTHDRVNNYRLPLVFEDV